jgi:hypothetical protein
LVKAIAGDKLRLNQTTTIDLINYRQHLTAVKGLEPATVNRRFEALRRFCKWARISGRLRNRVLTATALPTGSSLRTGDNDEKFSGKSSLSPSSEF